MSTNDDPFANHPLLEAMLPVAMLSALDEVSHLTDTERHRLSADAATTIASHGDDLLYGGKHAGQTFAALTRALAVLAHRPGGVTFAGLHWCVGSGHHGTREQTPCTAELHREQADPACRSRHTSPSSEPGTTA